MRGTDDLRRRDDGLCRSRLVDQVDRASRNVAVRTSKACGAVRRRAPAAEGLSSCFATVSASTSPTTRKVGLAVEEDAPVLRHAHLALT